MVRVLDGLFGCSSLGANRRRARRSQIAVLGSGDALTVEYAKPRTRFMLMAGKPDGEKPVYIDRTSTDAISTAHLARVMDQQLRDDWAIIDQPAALGPEPIRTIGREELKSKLDRGGDFKLIMALNRWAFEAKHIPGSIHFDTPAELYAAVRPDDEVVVYCSWVDCLSSVALYRDLVRRGYRNVRRYSGGLLDWEEAGLPLEGKFAAVR